MSQWTSHVQTLCPTFGSKQAQSHKQRGLWKFKSLTQAQNPQLEYIG